MKKVLLTGGSGRLGKEIKKQNTKFDICAPNRREMNICIYADILEYVSSFTSLCSPEISTIVHCAALTNPMRRHEQNIGTSINNNIIGTANLSVFCAEFGIKMVYVSTDYVYPGMSPGMYAEESPVKPVNNYAWSKMGGECSVQMLPNSLILRCAITERPFKHNKALVDSRKSSLYIDDAASIILKLIDKDCSGVYNVGGVAQTIYDFAKRENFEVGKVFRTEIEEFMPEDTTMNITKMQKVLNER